MTDNSTRAKALIEDGTVKIGWGLIDYIQAPADGKARTFSVFKDKDGSYEVFLHHRKGLVLVERGAPVK